MILRLLLPLLMVFGTMWSASNTTTTKTVPVPTDSTSPVTTNVMAVTHNCPSSLCDGFECGEGEYCSTSNSGFFAPRCRSCSLVEYSCSDMDVVRTKFKGCETFCFNSQRTALIQNCSREKGMLTEDLSRCTSEVSNAGLENKKQQNETSALQLRILSLEASEKEARAKADALQNVAIGLGAALVLTISISGVIFCRLLKRRADGEEARSVLNHGECCKNPGYLNSVEKLGKGQNAKDSLDSKQDADKPLALPETHTEREISGCPTEEALSGHNNRNHLAPTGDRTEHVNGDQNDFLSMSAQTMTSPAHNNGTNPRGEDFMTSSSGNVSSSGDDQDPQCSGLTSFLEESVKANQPLLPRKILATQPEQERHNSEYKYGSNTLLNKVCHV